jgi:predicted metal-dependent peptidase
MRGLSHEHTLEEADAHFFQKMRLTAAEFQPYLASAIFAMIPVPSPGLGTFSVDRHWRLYLDMNTARSWGLERAAGVLLHETHHLVRNHHERGARHPVARAKALVWNVACDAAINDDLEATGIMLPDPILPSTFGLPMGGIEEGYYDRLCRDDHASETLTCGSGAGGPAVPDEIDDQTAPIVDDIDGFTIREAVRTAITTRPQSATVPSGLLKWAKGEAEPQVSWRTLLRRSIARERTALGSIRTTWSRPHRRSDLRDEVLRPGHHRVGTRIAVVFDTSSSMNPTLLDAAASEIRGILTTTPGRSVTLISCDDRAHLPRQLHSATMVHLRGGGGTDLRAGITAASELIPSPHVIIVLTDGETPWPTSAPDGTELIAVVIGGTHPLPAGRGVTAVRVADP